MERINEDLYRYAGKVSVLSLLRTWALEPGFRYLIVFRLSKCDQWWSLAFRLLLLRLTVRYGIELPHRTQVGRGLYIGHFGSVTVNGRARLGDNVNIHKGVTIGAIAGPSVKAGVPVIGDRVWIGINAILVGGITVGDDAVILAGVYVDFDVPAGALVTHGPASLRSSHRAQHLIQNPV